MNMEGRTHIKYSEEEQRRAAYALNLCTVSVSQIVDYRDLVVLEQEYEFILNNLNLENMPKDEALLNILKQILDTITYFRIEEGDKAIIDKEYEHRLKNAVWSAVPNFGLIIAGGNPLMAISSVVSQVGIGYMNYRKNKAEYQLDLDKNYWQLQRTAIEQLNGLRRELFDAAWRLADEYGFPDKYRLTEKQISMYNRILEDKDSVRRYERLIAIEEHFCAYPPFWYQLGNTALQIANEYNFDESCSELYKAKAKAHYDKYFEVNRYQLLREDQMVAACALEYTELLNKTTDIAEIDKLLQYAEMNSAGSFDILQLCALQYLSIGNITRAKILLKRLVNEDYNTLFNAQILSNLYVSDYIYNRDGDAALEDYKMLAKRVGVVNLFQLPNGSLSETEINKSFYIQQREILLEKFHNALNQYIEKYTIRFNKIFAKPGYEYEKADQYFLDNEKARTKRIGDLKTFISDPKGKILYSEKLNEGHVPGEFLNLVNEMYNEIGALGLFNGDKEEVLLAEAISVEFRGKVMPILHKLNEETVTITDYEQIFELSFSDIVFEYFKEIDSQLRALFITYDSMDEIVGTMYKLERFCRIHRLNDNCFSVQKLSHENDDVTFSSILLGHGYEESKKRKEIKEKVNKVVSHYKENFANNTKVELISKINQNEFEEYFKKNKNSQIRKGAFAVIDARNPLEMDLILRNDGVIATRGNLYSELVPYNQLKLDVEGKLVIDYEAIIKERSYIEGVQIAKSLIVDVNGKGKMAVPRIMSDFVVGVVAGPIGLAAKKSVEAGVSIKMREGIHPFAYYNKNVKMDDLFKIISDLGMLLAESKEVNDFGRDNYDFLRRPLSEGNYII